MRGTGCTGSSAIRSHKQHLIAEKSLLCTRMSHVASTALEVLAGIRLIAGLWVRYAALLSLVLFAGTLTIFVIAPAVTGFPLLTLMGQFLLKDVVLASAAITLIARDTASHEAKHAQHPQLASRSADHTFSPVNSENQSR
jgi:uncharacterized membrane protein YphA (DoxX/SURF4 family)